MAPHKSIDMVVYYRLILFINARGRGRLRLSSLTQCHAGRRHSLPQRHFRPQRTPTPLPRHCGLWTC